MIDRLSILELEKSNIKRLLGCSFKKREQKILFDKLKIVQKEIKEIKFKLRVERMLKKNKGEVNNDFSDRSG